MIRTLLPLALLLVVGFFGFRSCFGAQTNTWYQRMTVTVDVPVGQVRGASVVQITQTVTMGPFVLPDARGVRAAVRGEAVAVEVLPGRWLFVLLTGGTDGKGDADQLAYHALRLGKDLLPSKRTYEALIADLRSRPLDTPSPVPPEVYPMMVTFDDITKPQTVREVDPADLAASFGPGVRLQSVELSLTQDPVTRGLVQSVLLWLDEYRKKQWRLNGARCKACPIRSDNLADLISTGAFSIGDN
jgi:hypothetical protein